MPKKSSKSRKGNSAAPKSGAAAANRGASSSHSSAFSPPSHGTGGGSSSGSTPPSPAVSASPLSLLHIPSIGASSSSSQIAISSPDFSVPPRATTGGDRMRLVEQHILDLQDHNRRENALKQLSKMTVAFHDLAPILWFSFGTMVVLLQEVISIYGMLSPLLLTPKQSKRACDAIALLECVASHPKTRILFARAHIQYYLYPFLNKLGEPRPLEDLKIATLGVISALVKVLDTRVVTPLLSSEIMPRCLHAMESGTETSRTLAAFVVQRLLQDDVVLRYICHLPERLFAVCQALGNVVAYVAGKPSVPLLKQVISCYLRLRGDQRGLCALKSTLPTRLSDGTFDHCLHEDETARIWLRELLISVQGPHISKEGGVIYMLTWMLSILVQ